jgi:hypothetical protein
VLKFLHGLPKAILLVVAMEWLLGDEDVWSPVLEYQLQRAIIFVPIVGLRSKFSTRCLPWGSYGLATQGRGCLVART